MYATLLLVDQNNKKKVNGKRRGPIFHFHFHYCRCKTIILPIFCRARCGLLQNNFMLTTLLAWSLVVELSSPYLGAAILSWSQARGRREKPNSISRTNCAKYTIVLIERDQVAPSPESKRIEFFLSRLLPANGRQKKAKTLIDVPSRPQIGTQSHCGPNGLCNWPAVAVCCV